MSNITNVKYIYHYVRFFHDCTLKGKIVKVRS